LFFLKKKQKDLLTVSETAQEPPSDADGVNSPDSLALEATAVQNSFCHQVLTPVRYYYLLLFF